MKKAWERLDSELVHRSFLACGILPSSTWEQAVHGRLKEKIFPDEPVQLSSSDSDESLDEGGFFSDSDDNGKHNINLIKWRQFPKPKLM